MSGFETARLRMWRDEDLDAYARVCADPEAMHNISGGATRTREQCEATVARFVRAWEERGYGMWEAEDKETGELVGRIGLLYHADWAEDHKTEIAWQIGRSRWGRGLATVSALASLRYGFEEARLERIISLAVPRISLPGGSWKRRG